ncbi:lmo0937 family membrane protein [Neobacillus sp. SM06]|uniref:lmo0937 family membrane protein n=1 Tax=Neobacillus sp. SM06 TaxID=3422492 RepID=UPI003D26EC83
MLWTIIGLLLLFWVLGLVFHIAGGLIHLLLVIAIVVFVFKLISGRGRNRV